MDTLAHGGVAEQPIPGTIRSTSVQLRILPSGEAVVLSTHDQVLGGERGQTFVACRSPAARAYAAAIAREAREAREAGDYLAEQGLVGRVGVDVVVARHDGGWHPYAVEMNLREGGTSHAYETLWLLTGGSLDQATMTFRASSGEAKHYFATHRLRDPGYRRIGLENSLAAATESRMTGTRPRRRAWSFT